MVIEEDMHVDQQEQPGEMTDVLYERYATAIFMYLRQRTRTREDAEDVLEEIFIAAMEDGKFHLLSEQAQRGWLWRVAQNKVVDNIRRASVRQHLSLEQVEEEAVFEDETNSPERAALHLDMVAQVEELLQPLSPLQREVMRLRFGSNLRSAEIATLLGKRETAIRTMISRTLNFLRMQTSNRETIR